MNVIRAGSDQLVRSIGFGGFSPSVSTVFPDNSFAAVGNSNNLLFFHTKSLEVAGSIPIPAIGSLAFTSDGAYAYAPLPDQKAVALLEIFTRIAIEILPGVSSKQIRPPAGITVSVAIHSQGKFDPTAVDPLSVTLAGAPVKRTAKGQPMAELVDANRDGMLDRLVVHFDASALRLKGTDAEVVLEGTTSDGVRFRGLIRSRSFHALRQKSDEMALAGLARSMMLLLWR